MTNPTAICAEYSTHATDRPPVGPCVLRPGHRGDIHQDMRGIQWATRPDSSGCCVCGDTPIDYHNYLEQSFCWPCADGQAPTAISGTDHELRARLIAAIRAIGRGEQEIVELRAELRSRDEVIGQQRAAARNALRDVAAVARVRALADRWYGQGAPATSYARELLATLDNAA
ncbi:hypothetical protein ACFCV8_00840 [Streptomyces sp. NPDC056347]|uniref:hypothetical protein n=1 Tax=Streptomyces sp. NPDC056347 TaxID=3345790 RepID=UPI0035E1A189